MLSAAMLPRCCLDSGNEIRLDCRCTFCRQIDRRDTHFGDVRIIPQPIFSPVGFHLACCGSDYGHATDGAGVAPLRIFQPERQ